MSKAVPTKRRGSSNRPTTGVGEHVPIADTNVSITETNRSVSITSSPFGHALYLTVERQYEASRNAVTGGFDWKSRTGV
jgi:hypothetical protein